MYISIVILVRACMELPYCNKASILNSNLGLHGGGGVLLDSNILDIDYTNEMCNEYSTSDDPSFAPEPNINRSVLSYHHHQPICSSTTSTIPPTFNIGPSEASKNRMRSCFHYYGDNKGPSNSGGESEAAVSQGSSSTQPKRKLGDYRHSSSACWRKIPDTCKSEDIKLKDRNHSRGFQAQEPNSTSFGLPPTLVSARGGGGEGEGGGGFQIFLSMSSEESKNNEPEAMAQMKEMIYRAAALRPLNLDAAAATKRRSRRNVRISSDPQTAAARQRRERVSERLRVLRKLVPGGSKMDTASMLDEAANYLSFLKSQVAALETLAATATHPTLLMQHMIDHQHHHYN